VKGLFASIVPGWVKEVFLVVIGWCLKFKVVFDFYERRKGLVCRFLEQGMEGDILRALEIIFL